MTQSIPHRFRRGLFTLAAAAGAVVAWAPAAVAAPTVTTATPGSASAATPAAVTAAAAVPADITPVKVAASRLAGGHAVYVRGLDGRIWWRTVETFGSPEWPSTWRSTDGLVASGPDVVDTCSDCAFLAARSTRSTLLIRYQTGPTFGRWYDLGGIITSAPVVMLQPGTANVWVFARGADAGVWYRIVGATTAPWRSLGGKLTSAPDAVATAGMRVYGRGLDAVTWARSRRDDGTWAPWSRVGLPVNSATCTVGTDALFQIQYWRGADRHVYIMGDLAPRDLGGLATSAPDASYNGEVVAVRGDDNGLWARVNGAAWRNLGGKAA